MEETDNQFEKQRGNKGKARRFMVDEFLMCVYGSEEAQKAPKHAAREENPYCRQLPVSGISKSAH